MNILLITNLFSLLFFFVIPQFNIRTFGSFSTYQRHSLLINYIIPGSLCESSFKSSLIKYELNSKLHLTSINKT